VPDPMPESSAQLAADVVKSLALLGEIHAAFTQCVLNQSWDDAMGMLTHVDEILSAVRTGVITLKVLDVLHRGLKQ
jgi:hypothetical protein